jgi:hypothetical protein
LSPQDFEVAVAASQREAIRMFPQIGILDSPMNRGFRERYQKYRKDQPEYFREANWPVKLAKEVAPLERP